MRYYQLGGSDGNQLAARSDGELYDLTAARAGPETFGDLADAAAICDRSVDAVAEGLLADAPALDVDAPAEAAAAPPLRAEEVWAAGVTYRISEEAREAESSQPDIYLDVYDSERPEVFLKATPSRTVGPGAAVGIRADSTWDVPEPELGIVLHRGEVVGYTVGNDVSSRSIEGANPLYLPQAKVYDRCCSIGPCVRSAATTDPHDLEMWMTISRDGEPVYEDSTTTAEMVRTVGELVEYCTKHNAVPERAVLLTGTSLVPDEGFTLRAGDVVDIGIEGIGTLTNPVTQV